MLMPTFTARLLVLVALWLASSTFTHGDQIPTAFHYQGYLRADNTPVHGLMDLQFALFPSADHGEPLSNPVLLTQVPVDQGRFTVTLDFGLTVIQGPILWLDIAVRPPLDAADFTHLTPRQQLLPVPHAIHARNADQATRADVATLADAATQADVALALPAGTVTAESIAEASLTADRIAPGQLVTRLNSLQDDIILAVGPNLALSTNGQTLTFSSPAHWRLEGNADTNPELHFIGTIDKQPLDFRVNNTRAFRLSPGWHPGVVNVLGGSRGNFIQPEVSGATIAGGGGSFGAGGEYTNSLHASYATIAGGWANRIGPNAGSAFIGGGHSNQIHLYGFESVIGGGLNNHITEDSWQATIGGGSNNRVEYTGYVATISGGSSNRAGSYYTSLGGGARNAILYNARYATISGGGDNSIHQNSFSSVIGGGGDNQVLGSSERSTIGGGKFNQIATLSPHATIGGGFTNTIGPNAHAATIPGGDANRADGRFAFAAGQRAHALHSGSFVWADATKLDFPSTATNQFSVRALGGVRFVSAVDLDGAPASGVVLAPGEGSWSSLSDREAKENFGPVDPRAILDQLLEIPMETWNYKAQCPSVRHLGPMAQDFQAAFQLGADPRRITTVDAQGVALAAIQGLHQIVIEKDSRIQSLEQQNRQLEQRLQAVESLLLLIPHQAPPQSPSSAISHLTAPPRPVSSIP
jgi:trimeric autotransporter adhesin